MREGPGCREAGKGGFRKECRVTGSRREISITACLTPTGSRIGIDRETQEDGVRYLCSRVPPAPSSPNPGFPTSRLPGAGRLCQAGGVGGAAGIQVQDDDDDDDDGAVDDSQPAPAPAPPRAHHNERPALPDRLQGALLVPELWGRRGWRGALVKVGSAGVCSGESGLARRYSIGEVHSRCFEDARTQDFCLIASQSGASLPSQPPARPYRRSPRRARVRGGGGRVRDAGRRDPGLRRLPGRRGPPGALHLSQLARGERTTTTAPFHAQAEEWAAAECGQPQGVQLPTNVAQEKILCYVMPSCSLRTNGVQFPSAYFSEGIELSLILHLVSAPFWSPRRPPLKEALAGLISCASSCFIVSDFVCS